MRNLNNFIAESLCEYNMIFPNVVSVLDHIFFTIGNGYSYNSEIGEFMEQTADKYVSLSDYPTLTEKGWQKLIKKCHVKEKAWATHHKLTDEELAKACAVYKPVTVDNYDFSVQGMYMQIREVDLKCKSSLNGAFKKESFIRPYPFDTTYSGIFKLDQRSSAWLIQVAINFSTAWVQYLDSEIKYEHVYKEKPTELKNDQFIGSVDDYSNMEWTTKHRDMLVELIPKLQAIFDSKFSFKAGDNVVVVDRDPFWTYSGAAEAKPRMTGRIVQMADFEEPPAGKVAVAFKEKTLGYMPSDKGDITLFINPAILALK